MIIGQIKDGIVLDHITAGRCMDIYNILKLGEMSSTVAMIKNADSVKMGKKDIIKIDADVDLKMDIIGYVDPNITVDIIRDGVLAEKRSIDLPEKLQDVIFCKNPRCITTTEQELPHIFKLTDRENRVYRCIYCETKK